MTTVSELLIHFLDVEARKFSEILQDAFSTRFKDGEREQHTKDVEKRLVEEIHEELQIILALETWRRLPDRYFRIAYAIFWNNRP